MSQAEDPPQETKRHVTTLLVASPRALNNALDELGFAENDDRVVEHDGRLAFVTCSHEPDCDDLFALIAELAQRGESWELLSRIDRDDGPVTFHSLGRFRSVEAVDTEATPEEAATADEDLPMRDLDTEAGLDLLRKDLRRTDAANMFVSIGAGPGGRVVARVLQRNPRRAIAAATAADEARIRNALRGILPTVMFDLAMRPTS
jgi:hypothetical protein